MEKVRLGIIGMGNMGSGHAKNLMDGKVPEIANPVPAIAIPSVATGILIALDEPTLAISLPPPANVKSSPPPVVTIPSPNCKLSFHVPV